VNVAKTDDRLFAPFPIEMDEHPKIIGLSDSGFRALFEAVFYSRRMMSDGFLDERVVLRRWGRDAADELSSNDPERPSWIRVDAPRPGWRIHDFDKHHPLRADIEEKRAAISSERSKAGKKGAAKRWQADGKSVANDSSETESETETTTPKGVVRASRRKPATSMPDGWMPKPAHVAFAIERGVDGRHEEGQFRAWAASKDARYRDWDAAFRSWLGRATPQKLAPTARAQRTVMLATDLLEIEQ
jgi:hypothetical protein